VPSIEFRGESLVSGMVHDLRIAGNTPVAAIERALEAQFIECFGDAMRSRLFKKPVIRLHSRYFKEPFATLPSLISSPYETWYPEIHFATRIGDEVLDLTIGTDSIELVPLLFGGGVTRVSELKHRRLKRQTNHQFRINQLRVKAFVFENVLSTLSRQGGVQQPWIANFLPTTKIIGFRTVTFDHMLTGERVFCRCSQSYHTIILNLAKQEASSFTSTGWPHSIIGMLSNAEYKDQQCHLCLARNVSTEEAIRYYGHGIEVGYESYVDQVSFDLGVDAVTAREEIKQVLGLSRWVNEALLYSIIRKLFPDYRVDREASPAWLGRMRLDIYLPELKLAIEYQGEQHYRPLKMFGGEGGFERVVARDAAKRRLCDANGVTVIDVRFDGPLTIPAMRQRLRRYLVR
jgi:hypothetical protein